MEEAVPEDLQEKREAVHNMLEPMYFNSEDEFQRYWSWFQIQYETQGSGTRTKSDFQQRTSARCRCRRDATRRDRVREDIRKRARHANTLDCPATLAIVRSFRSKTDELPYAVRIERTRNWPLPETHTHTAEWMINQRGPSLMMYKSWRNPGTAVAARVRVPKPPEPEPVVEVQAESELALPTLLQTNPPVNPNPWHIPWDPTPQPFPAPVAYTAPPPRPPPQTNNQGNDTNERNIRAVLDRELQSCQREPPPPPSLRNQHLSAKL
ncbi:hypothetical protein PRZ48_007996 [Zasmidium cellare]|uniref:Uncharacterized protein n=1 Tax=Zasmidium cellare TaxID=395010 RepID=A0ABR0EEU5_ZASCE|nr:hypothetical protein PRZ48_007996 [Zasmidium cellare]